MQRAIFGGLSALIMACSAQPSVSSEVVLSTSRCRYAEDILAEIRQLPDWASTWAGYLGPGLSDSDIDAYINVAKRFQQYPLNQIYAGFECAVESTPINFCGLIDLGVVLRFMFDVPKRVERTKNVYIASFLPEVVGISIDTSGYEIAWPVYIEQSGQPTVDLFRGCSGPPYDPLKELKYFSQSFEFRQL